MPDHFSVNIDPQWFYFAINYFRQRFSPGVFVALTDDVEWVRYNIFGDDIFYPDSNVGVDFTIMRECNHSIVDYGSYGLWGSLLRTNGGGVTVFAHEKTYTDKFSQDNQYIGEANLTDFIWLYVNVTKQFQPHFCLSHECQLLLH